MLPPEGRATAEPRRHWAALRVSNERIRQIEVDGTLSKLWQPQHASQFVQWTHFPSRFTLALIANLAFSAAMASPA